MSGAIGANAGEAVIVRYTDDSKAEGVSLLLEPTGFRVRIKSDRGEVTRTEPLSEVSAIHFVYDASVPEMARVPESFRVSSVSGSLVRVDLVAGGAIEGWLVAEQDRFGYWVIPEDPECNSLKIFVPETSARRISRFGAGASEPPSSSAGFTAVKPEQVVGSVDLPAPRRVSFTPPPTSKASSLEAMLADYVEDADAARPLSQYDLTESPDRAGPAPAGGLSKDVALPDLTARGRVQQEPPAAPVVPDADDGPTPLPPVPQPRTVQLESSSESLPAQKDPLDVLMEAPLETQVDVPRRESNLPPIPDEPLGYEPTGLHTADLYPDEPMEVDAADVIEHLISSMPPPPNEPVDADSDSWPDQFTGDLRHSAERDAPEQPDLAEWADPWGMSPEHDDDDGRHSWPSQFVIGGSVPAPPPEADLYSKDMGSSRKEREELDDDVVDPFSFD